MLTYLAVALVALVTVVLILAVTKPATFRLQRSADINAAPATVFAHLQDFHQWGGWSPWERMDPALKRTFSGAPSGKGAIYEWTGNAKVGTGRMEIMESSPPAKLVVKLDFLKPFEAHNTAEFTLEARDSGTHLVWAMYGPSPFMSKVMQVFVSMDSMVGKDFAAGLANLKGVAERG